MPGDVLCVGLGTMWTSFAESPFLVPLPVAFGAPGRSLLPPTQGFSLSLLQQAEASLWSVSSRKFLLPCALRSTLTLTVICTNVVLFSLSPWQGLRPEPGRKE